MQLFVYQPGARSGSYHTISGFVAVHLFDDSVESERLGNDALDFENSLTDSTRIQSNDLGTWLSEHGYTLLDEDNAWPTYGLFPKPEAKPEPTKEPEETPGTEQPQEDSEGDITEPD